MATKKKSIGLRSRKAAVALRPAATTQRLPVAPVLTVPIRPLLPPLESSLDRFGRELRAELDKAKAAIETQRAELAALRAQLDALSKRHDQHTHSYTTGVGGSGGHLWLDLGFLKNYLDGDNTLYDGHGIYWRGGPSTGDAPEHRTGTPGP